MSRLSFLTVFLAILAALAFGYWLGSQDAINPGVWK